MAGAVFGSPPLLLLPLSMANSFWIRSLHRVNICARAPAHPTSEIEICQIKIVASNKHNKSNRGATNMSQKVRKRSRGGCINCKKNKKKCDEIKPICSACMKLHRVCQYRLHPHKSPDLSNKFIGRREVIEMISRTLNSDHLLEYDIPLDEESFKFTDFFQHYSFPLSRASYIPLPAHIDDVELSYLEFFCRNVLPESYMLLEDGNFSKYYIPMAFTNKSVLYSLIAWGCRAMRNQGLNYQIENLEADAYVEKVQSIVARNNNFLTRDTFIANICCSMILVCMKISFGDTNGWSDCFTQCFNMINGMPGSFKYLKEECSIEGQALAESFAYYDVLASQSNENGTFFSIGDYKDLFTKKIFSHNLYQGFLRPIIFLIGEIVSLLVEYNSLKASFDLPECDKFEVVSTIIERANGLDKDIQFTKLDGSYLKRIKSEEEEEVEEHLTLFELYQLSAQIYVRQVIKKLPPIVPEIEVLFFALKQDLQMLVKAKRLKNILGFPMLIAGVSAVTKEDRDDVTDLFNRMIQTCGYMSGYQKLWIVIKQIWEINKNGAFCVDWFDITKEMGWKLNLGR